MLRPLSGLILAALVLLPVASAGASTKGDFTTQGAVILPPGSDARFSALALFVGETSGLTGKLSFPELRVFIYEEHDVVVRTGVAPAIRAERGPVDERSFTLHNATVTLTPGAGFLGLYPRPEGSASFKPRGEEWSTSPSAASVVPHDQPSTPDEPAIPVYSKEISGPHLEIDSPGDVQYAGPAAIKIGGPHVRIDAENVTEADTGEDQTNPAEVTLRWIFLEWDVGSLILASEKPAQIAAATITFACDGTLTFTPTAGVASTDAATYPARGSETKMDGRFDGRLIPMGPEASLSFSGDLRSTSLIARPVSPRGAAGHAFDWLAFVAFGAFIVGGAGVAILTHKRTREPAARPVSAEERAQAKEYARRADEAAERRTWLQALDLIQGARRLDPAEPRYAIQEGICLHALGELQRAIDALDAAGRLTETGEPELWAGKAALGLEDADLAERYFLAALDRPALLGWIPGELTRVAREAGLLERADLRAALEEADKRQGGA